ncbi:hypothetical protein EIM50_22715 [Pseudoxanthomonas sp. SGD-10]|nr:hypothetical protein EIM50_22715 [Pseudoxanthomonas sp. SGD-10]
MDKYFLSIAGFLLSVLMISSCSKKDNADIGFPQGTFSSKNTLKVYKAELYTNKGKTNDETIIENFIGRKSLKHIFLDSQIETIYQFIPFTIEIDEEGNFTSTSFHNPYASGKVERLKGNELLLPSNDSTADIFQ